MALEREGTHAASLRDAKKMGRLLAKISTELMKSVRKSGSQAVTLNLVLKSSMTTLLRWAEISSA